MEKVCKTQELELLKFPGLGEVKTKVNAAFRTVRSCPLPAYMLAGTQKPWVVAASVPNLPTRSHILTGSPKPPLLSPGSAMRLTSATPASSSGVASA